MIPDVRRLGGDGLPIYFAERSGQSIGQLTFRVGRGDEGAARSGLTHMVEHLALYRVGRRPYDYNGEVDLIRTRFFAVGDEAEVASHLVEVCANLTSLPLERLAQETRVLRDEAAQRGASIPDYHAWLRWGLRGPGVASIPEYGLFRLATSDVASWSAEHFTSRNAAVVWVGPTCPDLPIVLPEGRRSESLVPGDLYTAPVWTPGPDGVVSMSLRFPRSAAAAASVRILAESLEGRLRYDMGVSYSVSGEWVPISASTALGVIWVATNDDNATTVRETMLDAIERMRDVGPADSELSRYRDGFRRMLGDPMAAVGEADRMAEEELLGMPATNSVELKSNLESLGPDEVKGVFAAASGGLILAQPTSLDLPRAWLEPVPDLAPGSYSGRVFFDGRESGLKLRSARYPRIVVADDGIAIVDPAGMAARIPYSECELAVEQPDGTLSVMHANGTQIDVSPGQVRDGVLAVGLIMAKVPAGSLVRMPKPQTNGPERGVSTGRASLIVAALFGAMECAVGLDIVNGVRPAIFVPSGEASASLVSISGVLLIVAGSILPVFVYLARRFHPRSWGIGAVSGAAGLLASSLWLLAGGPFENIALFGSAGVLTLLWQNAARRLHQVEAPAASPAGGAAQAARTGDPEG